jgi:hypothetical protein
MASVGTMQVESESISDFARAMQQDVRFRPTLGRIAAPGRLELNPERVKNGLGQLVLTVVKLLHELLERQALRRVAGGSLTEEQIERIGITLMRQAEELNRLRVEFGLEEEDLDLDLGPLGRLF